MRCDQCQHWGEEAQDWESRGIGFRKCNAVLERWTIQDNSSAQRTDIAARKEALRKARAYVQDGSEYRADLVTGPDFFCGLFKQR